MLLNQPPELDTLKFTDNKKAKTPASALAKTLRNKIPGPIGIIYQRSLQ